MKPTVVQQHFDNIATIYDTYKGPTNLYYRSLKKTITRLVPSQKRVLDIGCGTGEILSQVSAKNGKGIDISKQMIRIAQSKFSKNRFLSFQQHDIEKAPIKGNFDYILFNDVIEHLTQPQKAIRSIAQTMHSNTTLILSMANPFWEFFLMFLEKVHLKMPEGVHYRISEKNLIRLLRDNQLYIRNKYVSFPHIPVPFLKNIGLIYVYVIKKTQK